MRQRSNFREQDPWPASSGIGPSSELEILPSSTSNRRRAAHWGALQFTLLDRDCYLCRVLNRTRDARDGDRVVLWRWWSPAASSAARHQGKQGEKAASQQPRVPSAVRLFAEDETDAEQDDSRKR